MIAYDYNNFNTSDQLLSFMKSEAPILKSKYSDKEFFEAIYNKIKIVIKAINVYWTHRNSTHFQDYVEKELKNGISNAASYVLNYFTLMNLQYDDDSRFDVFKDYLANQIDPYYKKAISGDKSAQQALEIEFTILTLVEFYFYHWLIANKLGQTRLDILNELTDRKFDDFDFDDYNKFIKKIHELAHNEVMENYF